MSAEFSRLADVASFANSTYAPLFRLQASLTHPESNSLPEALIERASMATAVTNLLVSFPFQRSKGRHPLPPEVVTMTSPSANANLSPDWYDPATYQPAVQDLVSVAKMQLAEFRHSWKQLKPPHANAMTCAFLQLVSKTESKCNIAKHVWILADSWAKVHAEIHLKRLSQNSFDPTHSAVQKHLWQAPLKMAAASFYKTP